MRILAMVLCLISLSACNHELSNVMPQPTAEFGDIEGIVKTNDGRPAAGITVQLVRSTSTCFLCGWGTDTRTLVGTLQADDEGRFEFKKVRIGHYIINLGGFEDYFTLGDYGLSVRADQTTALNYTISHLTGD